MARQRSRRDGNTTGILKAEVSDVRQIATILKAVDIHSETKATVTVQPDGLSFNVEVGSTVTARAHLHHTNNFRSYEYNHHKNTDRSRSRVGIDGQNNTFDVDGDEQERTVFEISLTALLSCINIFGDSTVKPVSAKQAIAREKWKQRQRREEEEHNGYGRHNDRDGDEDDERVQDPFQAGSFTTSKKKTATAMHLTWEAEGCPLILMLEEGGVVTRCEITTFEANEVIDLPYDDSQRMQKLILNSSWLSEALSEIDATADRVRLGFRPPRGTESRQPPQAFDDDQEDGRAARSMTAFGLEAKGANGSVLMEYPFTREVLEVCECERAIRNSYKFSSLGYVRAALSYSTKTSVRTDSNGVLSLQFMIADASGREGGYAGFVEFTVMPLNEED